MKNILLISLLMTFSSAVEVSAIENEIKNEVEVNDTSRVVDLDEVFVVAQPKETMLLRQQALSSSIFSSRELNHLGVRDLRQLSVYVPSFSMPNYGSRLTSSMYIRGIGSRISNSAVGVYYDNIPLISPASFNSHFYMLDRVDVLRGPQGTLYGANSEGGIVRIYSKDPMSYQGTDFSAGISSVGVERHVELAHFHRPSENLAFSVAGFYHGQDGYFNNTYLNAKADCSTEAGGKLRLIWKPSDGLKIDLSSDYQYTNQRAFPYGAYNVADEYSAEPSTDLLPGYKRNLVNTGVSISYEMNRFLLTSTTSHQYLRDHMDMDIDYTSKDMMVLKQLQKMNAVTEEITLRTTENGFWQHTTGLFASRRWLRTDADVTFGREILDPIGNGIKAQMTNAMIAAMKAGMVKGGMPEAVAESLAKANVGKMGVMANADVMRVPNVFHQPVTNFAIYHETNLNLTSRLTATLGLRYDFTKVEIDYDALGYVSITAGTASKQATNTLTSHLVRAYDTNHGQLLPKIGLSYKIGSQGSNIYALASKGYMAGGYNIQLFSDILNADLNDPKSMASAQKGDYDVPHTEVDYNNIEDAISYKPEESWNFEAGAHLNLFDNMLHADISAYYTLLHNQQLAVMAPHYGFGRMTVNAGKSRSIGAELSLRGNLFDSHLNWAATYSYTNATFRDYKDMVQIGKTNVEVDYKGNYIPYVPSHMFSAMADYRFDVSSDRLLRSLTVGANVQGNGKIYWDDTNSSSQKLYAVLGAHVLADFGGVNVDFWGRNITDTKYCTFAMPFRGSFIGQRGLPFHCGIDLKIHL